MNDLLASGNPSIELRFATVDDVGLILDLIRQLAEHVSLPQEVVADEDQLTRTLFGRRRVAEVVIASHEDEPAAFVAKRNRYAVDLECGIRDSTRGGVAEQPFHGSVHGYRVVQAERKRKQNAS